MGHLRRLAIKNYRSIKSANMRLGEITVIVGPSDSGKSNLVRALRDWAFNAAGDNFIAHGTHIARVALAIGHDHKVVWQKQSRRGGDGSTGKSSYIVADATSGQKPLRFEKCGITVPKEVQEITGLRLLEVDDLSIPVNFAEQDEPWFLLSRHAWTPGKVTKVIGKISGIEALILANRDLETLRIREQREGRECRAKAEQHALDLKQFGNLTYAHALAAKAEKLLETVQLEKKTLEQALGLVKQIADKKGRLSRAKGLVRVGRAAVERADALGLVANWEKLARAEEVARSLVAAEHRQSEAEQGAAHDRQALEDVSGALEALAEDGGLVCPLCGKEAHQECRNALRAEAKRARK